MCLPRKLVLPLVCFLAPIEHLLQDTVCITSQRASLWLATSSASGLTLTDGALLPLGPLFASHNTASTTIQY